MAVGVPAAGIGFAGIRAGISARSEKAYPGSWWQDAQAGGDDGRDVGIYAGQAGIYAGQAGIYAGRGGF